MTVKGHPLLTKPTATIAEVVDRAVNASMITSAMRRQERAKRTKVRYTRPPAKPIAPPEVIDGQRRLFEEPT